MSKKMTQKEFKEIVNKYFPLEVYGWEVILAGLERCQWENAHKMEDLGLERGAQGYKKTANAIHDELESRGYYD